MSSPDPSQTDSHDVDTVTEIITEFTEVLAFSRSRWARSANGVQIGLGAVGMMVLQFISRKGPLTATDLCQILDMDKSFVSRQVAKLRELGFVEANPAPDDGRVQLLTPSDEALALMNHIRTQWVSAYRERFSDWSDADLVALRDSLHRFNAAAEVRTTPIDRP